jgi:release factor glutamine methyltransferase
MNISELLQLTQLYLKNHDIPSSRLDAEVLLSRYLGVDHIELYVHPENPVPEAALPGFNEWVRRRCEHEPVAYIIGEKEFWGMSFAVNKDVLIPRPDTEILVEEVLTKIAEQNDHYFRILEIGTGSGAISVAIASEIKNVHICATDISKKAVSVASKNAIKHETRNVIDFVVGDMLESLCGIFDIIVSNPPYIHEDEFKRLPMGVAGYEPSVALLAGSGGTEYHDVLIRAADTHLKKNGWLLMEIGDGQKDDVEKLLERSKLFIDIGFRKDYAGKDRVAKGRRI